MAADSVQFGLDTFGDVTHDKSGNPETHAQVIRNVIEEGVLADKLGIDFFGIGEHHRQDFAVSSPETVLATIAGRTSRIHLGSAVTVLSSDDPIRVFQRFSSLDAASNGRAEVILGRGSFTESFPLFGFELSQYEKLFEEKLDLFAALLTNQPVTWTGILRCTASGNSLQKTTGSDSLADAEARSEKIQDENRRLASIAMRAAALNFYGTPYEAIAVAEEAVALANQMNDSPWLCLVEYGLGQSYFLAGRLRDAERHLAKAIALLTSAPKNVPPGTTGSSLLVLCLQSAGLVGDRPVWDAPARRSSPRRRQRPIELW